MRQPLPAGLRSVLVTAFILTGTAYAQEPAKLHRVQDSFRAPIHAGTFHVATGQFQRATSFSGGNDGPTGVEAIYRNNFYTAVFLDINGSHQIVDEGRLPSTSSPSQTSPYPSVQGLADSYQVNNIQLAYATDSVGDGTAQLTFYEQYRPCINPVGTLTPILDLTIVGLPGTLTPGTTTPYTFDIDMSGFEFCVRADGDGQFDGDAFDFFGWGLEMSADPGSMIGPIVGARPGALAPTGEGTCFSNPSATVASGLYSIDQAYEIELASGNGRCFNEGGYDEVDNDPCFVSFWLVLGANLGFSCVSCVEGIDDEYEDNDTCATAVPVPSNLTTGNLVVRKPGVDEDYYRVTVAPNSTLTATVFFNQFQADIDLWLIDDTCTFLLDASETVAGVETVQFNNTSGNPVDVIVNPFVFGGSVGECGDYTMVLDNTPPSTIIEVAQAEALAVGALTGTYLQTHADDNLYEVLTEVESGGKPANRRSRAEHLWLFQLPSGNSLNFTGRAYQSPSVDGDNWRLEYSLDQQSWTTLFVVSSTQSDAPAVTVPLPASIVGPVYVRIRDTDRTQGNRELDSVFIDYLAFEVMGTGGGNPPGAPTNLVAVANSSTEVGLTWIDGSSDEDQFELERSLDGLAWSSVNNSIPANSTAFSDAGLTPDTEYFYRVRASNAFGDSDWSNVASATTLGVGGSDVVPFGEIQGEGTLGGTFVNVTTADGVVQSLTERQSGGKPANRFSFASHTWRINAPSGSVELHLKASMIDAGDGESFEFDVSLDGGATWLPPALTVSPSTSGATYQIAPVTGAFGGGEIRVRVRDTDQSPGNRALEEVEVDHLFLRIS